MYQATGHFNQWLIDRTVTQNSSHRCVKTRSGLEALLLTTNIIHAFFEEPCIQSHSFWWTLHVRKGETWKFLNTPALELCSNQDLLAYSNRGRCGAHWSFTRYAGIVLSPATSLAAQSQLRRTIHFGFPYPLQQAETRDIPSTWLIRTIHSLPIPPNLYMQLPYQMIATTQAHKKVPLCKMTCWTRIWTRFQYLNHRSFIIGRFWPKKSIGQSKEIVLKNTLNWIRLYTFVGSLKMNQRSVLPYQVKIEFIRRSIQGKGRTQSGCQSRWKSPHYMFSWSLSPDSVLETIY